MSRLGDFYKTGGQYEHSPMMHVQDQKPTGTAGGASVAGDNARDLNTVLTNGISGASLNSNAVTLPAGKYFIEAIVPSFGTSRTWLSVRDSGGTPLVSARGYAYAGNTESSINASGEILLASSETLTVVQNCLSAIATNGLGVYTGRPGQLHETYTDLKIWQLDAIKTSPILTNNRLYPLPGSTDVTGNMYGLDYAKTSANTISVDAGICMDSLNTTVLTHSSLASVTIPTAINTIYNLFLQADGTVGVDTDVTGGTLGTVRRWIGFVLANASGGISEFYQKHDYLHFGKFTESTFLTGIGTGWTNVDYSSVAPVSRVREIMFGGESNTNDARVYLSDSSDIDGKLGFIRTYTGTSDTSNQWRNGLAADGSQFMTPVSAVTRTRMSAGTGTMAVQAVYMER